MFHRHAPIIPKDPSELVDKVELHFQCRPQVFDGIHIGRLCGPLHDTKQLIRKPRLDWFCHVFGIVVMLKYNLRWIDVVFCKHATRILLQDLTVDMIHPSLYLTYQTRSYCSHTFPNQNGTSAMLNNFEHSPIREPFRRCSLAPSASIRAEMIELCLVRKYHVLPIFNSPILVLLGKSQASTTVLPS
jgi:hypothetical protein